MQAGRAQPALGGTLSLPGEGSGGAERLEGPLRVAFSAPRGEAGLVTEVSVVFDRPVQPLDVVQPQPMPFRLTPEVAGSFRWVGSRAAVFTPKERLPFATQFRLEVPAGLTAVDGTKLAAPYLADFTTRRPAVLGAEPGPGSEGRGLDTQLRLELNQDVTPAALQGVAQLEAELTSGARKAIPFEVAAGKQPQSLVVKPKQALPANAKITFSVSDALRGSEGPLLAAAPYSLWFRTYEPLRSELSCHRPEGLRGDCGPESGVALIFNNAVRPREVLAKLRITPPVVLEAPYGAGAREGDELTTYVPLLGRFAAGERYQLALDAGVGDQFGQRLRSQATHVLKFADHYPRVDIGAVGRNFTGPALSVTVASRNVPRYELFTAALSPTDLLAWAGRAQRGGRDGGLDWLRGLGQVQVQQVSPRAPKNQLDRLLVEASKVLGGGRGALAIGARYQQHARDYDAPEKMKILNVSELGLSAKLSRFGSLVWVTERTSNAPVAGAEVALLERGRPERKYVTDSDGLAHIPAADFDPRLERQSDDGPALLVARRGADSAFALISEHIESWRLDVPSDFRGTLKPYGVAFSDRGIYRPGDEVMLKGIVRLQTATGNALPPQKTVDVVLRSSSGDDVAKQQALLTEYGTFATKLTLPPAAELGSYAVVVSGLEHQGFIHANLEVAEYRPAELKLEASASASSYLRGDTAELQLVASYLFGGAAAGLTANLSVSREPTFVQVPGAEDFSTSAEPYYSALALTSAAGELRRETRQLDAKGSLKWTEKLELPGQRGPELLRLDAEVTDVSRRSVGASGSAVVHPAAFYLGVKAGSSFVSAPAAIRPEVAAFSVSGQRLAGKRVAFELIERRYTFAREESGDDYRAVSKPVDTVKARCEATTTLETASCALNVPAAGYYLILVRAQDERGRQAEAATWLYAAGSGEPTWQDSDRRSVELVLDKKSYSVGERARVLVKSPYKEAEAWITVERAGVYQSFRRTLRGTAPSFDVTVTKELLPNAFIGVHLLPRRTGKGPVLEPGSYRLGYASLLVSGEGKRLGVTITPDKRDYRPGQNIDVKLSVKDARGAAAAGAEVTLYAADEGVLSLIDYRTPDPLATFSAPRPLAVATLESRDAEGKLLLESLGGGRDKGRDGGGGGELDVRRDFRQTAYFNPRILTDARGEAKVSFKLPESLTTYRLMAVAVARDDRYGYSQQRVTTSKPLMARPALPRFLRAGDSFEASVVVSKKDLSAGKVRVRAVFSGVEVVGPQEREVEVPRDGSLEVRFPARAPRAGEASVRFEVSAGSERDAASVALRVSPPLVAEVAAVYGQTNAARSEQLGALTQARDDYGALSVALSSTALVGVDQVALDLLDYPYGCSEQLASRLIPLVALGELGPGVGFVPPADHRKRAAALVGELVQRQRGDGGFAMWPESASSWSWGSPFITLALVRAQQAGVAVPKATLQQARDHLRRQADISGKNPDLPTAALALDVLVELGAPDAGGINRLFTERKRLPLFAKALLLHAAVRSKLGSDVITELKRELESALHVNGDRALVMEDAEGRHSAWLGSEARTQALVLRALSATGKHPLLTELARGLLGSRKQGRFRTTHESAWALLALVDYRRVAEPEAPRFEALVSLSAERLGGASFRQASAGTQRFELPMAKVKSAGAAQLVFEKEGSGQLFYEARLRYARKELPRTPLEAGFFVEKSLRAVKAENLKSGVVGAPPGIAPELSAGDLVLVDLTVVAPAAREHLVLDDPLPAGLEAIDPRFSTTAQWLRGGGQQDFGSYSGEYQQPAYDRSEVRDDRVVFFAESLPAGVHHYRYLARATTLGRFVLPPTRAEEMYEPEVFGRTAAAEVTVR